MCQQLQEQEHHMNKSIPAAQALQELQVTCVRARKRCKQYCTVLGWHGAFATNQLQ